MTRFDIEGLRQAARVAVDAEGLRPFARRTGITLGVIRAVLDNRDPAISSIISMSDALGLPLTVGPEMSAPSQDVEIDGADYTHIPLHEAFLSAGPGAVNGDVAIIDHLVFRHEWLRKIGLKPEHAAMARISGDSMAPGIHDGDLVLIDTSKREVPTARMSKNPSDLPIFAFMQNDEARVKRLERQEPSALVLYSDNHAFRPEVLLNPAVHSINILGQVVWSGHVWR